MFVTVRTKVVRLSQLRRCLRFACQSHRAPLLLHEYTTQTVELRHVLFKKRSTSWKTATAPALTDHAFHDAADCTLQHILDCVEALVESTDLEVDVSLENGVLMVECGKSGTFVLNKQTPNKQIWLASPVSGPLRYDYVSQRWLNMRDGHSLQYRFKHDFESICKTELNIL
ncbi:Frataxin/CyaY [Ostreococcus tauri]|uniref:ferroxidase n=1 Tax=Ostreococcus tauri TaxID=70448 RepID=A0A090N4M7_OSTTA|nr:Frataxin/CyaY [Ostreococcus tauri]CEG00980.1 Frataxin/CyaY [Ostreococcus tauri]|eukprot:XP_022840717.1 Frataxin/CyaY [Ostreococcus tauri]